MPFVRSTVDVNTNFERVTQAVNEHARRAVGIAAAVGARAYAAAGSARGVGDVTVLPPRGTSDGWEASFVLQHPAALFQGWGTLGNRVKPLKQPPRTTRTRAPGTGIMPLGHIDAGVKAGAEALAAESRRGI